tara:strand:+ start:1499 stop:3208 length:1710 start_codon:yes stop_codon:yes gene_type:complete
VDYIFGFLTVIGSLGLFIYGMKNMSEGIQRLAGNRLRELLAALTSNRLTGVLTGFGTTALIQSSSATTVMVVSFVNAGLLSLKQAISVIMGANIGTTVTAVLITMFGFSKFSLSSWAIPIIAIAFPLMFSSNDRTKNFSEFLIGFAILFMGLDALKHSVPDVNQIQGIHEFIGSLNEYGFLSLIIFILIGTLLTIIVQSSSAAIALTLTLCAKGIIGFENAAAIVLGENIGTTVTANLAALVGNVHAKRAARAHLLFNLMGVFWMIFAFPFFINLIDDFMLGFTGNSPLNVSSTSPNHIETVNWGLTLFHISFNVVNTFIFVWFVDIIENVVTKMVTIKNKIDREYHLEYIDKGLMGTPELSILEARKEVAKFGELTQRMMGFLTDLFTAKEPKRIEKRLKKIQKYEDITDRIEIEIADYLLKVSEGELSETSSRRLRSMLSIINELERIGDVLFQMSKNLEKKIESKTWFTPEQRNMLIHMFELIDKAFTIMNGNLDKDYNKINMDEANDLEKEIRGFSDQIRVEHLKSIENGDYNIRSGLIYTELFTACEKLRDHIHNINESIYGKV